MKNTSDPMVEAPKIDPTRLLPVVTAETHDDRWEFVVASFVCTEWFARASDEELVELVRCKFGGDLGSDRVAEYYDGKHPGITEMFRYQRDGFECHVNEKEAMAWLVAHRPHIAALVDA